MVTGNIITTGSAFVDTINGGIVNGNIESSLKIGLWGPSDVINGNIISTGPGQNGNGVQVHGQDVTINGND
jgi:hypothetical protein